MEIYIDFREVSEKAQFAQAIKVFALTNKDDNIYVITDKDKGTLVEDNNLKIIEYRDDLKISNLITVDNNLTNNKMMKLTFLRPSSKEIENVSVGDLNNSAFSLEEKYDLLKKYHLINKDRTFAILSSSIGLNKEFDDFAINHKDDESFCGKIMPVDIVPKGISNVLTTYDIANIFIDSLYYSVEFMKLKQEDEKSSVGFFQKLFSWDKGDNSKVVINRILCDYDLYLNEEKTIFVIKDGMTYNYYYYALNSYINILRRQ